MVYCCVANIAILCAELSRKSWAVLNLFRETLALQSDYGPWVYGSAYGRWLIAISWILRPKVAGLRLRLDPGCSRLPTRYANLVRPLSVFSVP